MHGAGPCFQVGESRAACFPQWPPAKRRGKEPDGRHGHFGRHGLRKSSGPRIKQEKPPTAPTVRAGSERNRWHSLLYCRRAWNGCLARHRQMLFVASYAGHRAVLRGPCFAWRARTSGQRSPRLQAWGVSPATVYACLSNQELCQTHEATITLKRSTPWLLWVPRLARGQP